MWQQLKVALLITIVWMGICGLAYPLITTGVAQIVFKDQANGSLIEEKGQVIGSALIGQTFEQDQYFQSRPSAIAYNIYEKIQKIKRAFAQVVQTMHLPILN